MPGSHLLGWVQGRGSGGHYLWAVTACRQAKPLGLDASAAAEPGGYWVLERDRESQATTAVEQEASMNELELAVLIGGCQRALHAALFVNEYTSGGFCPQPPISLA